MKILGIGNAIVDVLCKVDDDFLLKNSLIKSTMKLVNEEEFKTLLSLISLTNNYQPQKSALSLVLSYIYQ